MTRRVVEYRILRYFALAVALVACTPAAKVETSSEALRGAERGLSSAGVRVGAECPSGSWGGSGALVGSGLVVTAEHLTEDGCVYTVSGKSAKLRAVDKGHDLALLEVDLEGVVLPQAGDVWLGMDVWHVGFPSVHMTGRQELSVTRGVLASDLGDWYRVTATFYRGSSGGPIVSGRMELVGVVSRFWPSRPDEYYVTPAKYVWALMKKEGLTP